MNKYKVDKYDDPSSRYKTMWRLADDSGVEYQETFEDLNIPVTPSDNYIEITPATEDRLDLVSHQVYGTPLLWWVLAEASNLDNPLHVPVGTILRVPPKSSLYGLGGVVL